MKIPSKRNSFTYDQVRIDKQQLSRFFTGDRPKEVEMARIRVYNKPGVVIVSDSEHSSSDIFESSC